MTQSVQTNHTQNLSSDRASDHSRGAAAGFLAIIFGVFLLYAAGFTNSETLHNAAHDGRHSFIFPCH